MPPPTPVSRSPALVRAVPFILFVFLTFFQGRLGEASRYWVYLAKILIGAWMIFTIRPFVPEMRWKLSWQAVAVGIGVFVMWVGIDGWYPSLDKIGSWLKPGDTATPETAGEAWNPHGFFGANSVLAWTFIGVRILGSSLVVPPLEEIFFRSLLYRWIIRPDFESVPPGAFHWKAFVITSVIFAVEHQQWLAGLLCGFAYQGLVCWKGRLGDAITAHAITNALLGGYVAWRGAWNFW